jgi:hypothetical protein
MSVHWTKLFRAKTYAWAPGSPIDQLMQKRIVRAVDSQLAGKGMQKSDSAAPNVLLLRHAIITQDFRVTESLLLGAQKNSFRTILCRLITISVRFQNQTRLTTARSTILLTRLL